MLIIIHEQEELEAVLETLEIKLKKEKSEYIKITIEEEIKKIQQKLVILKQSIVDITNSTKIYKETIKPKDGFQLFITYNPERIKDRINRV